MQRNPSGFRFPGGESFLEMQARMASALARLVERHRGETVVAVSHADPIKAVVAQAAGTPLDLFQRLTVAPCSVSALAFTSGRAVRPDRQLHRLADRTGHRMKGSATELDGPAGFRPTRGGPDVTDAFDLSADRLCVGTVGRSATASS